MADLITEPVKLDHKAKLDQYTKFMKEDPEGFFNTTKKMIEDMTEVKNDHFLTPEVPLRLLTPNCPLWDKNLEDLSIPDPFWAFYWLGGEGITRYLLDNPDLIQGKTVLDVGSGCGSLAIAASKIGGAISITANDICPIASVAIQINADLNSCKSKSIKILTDNIISRYTGTYKYDYIFLGDMFYDDSVNSDIMEWLRRSYKLGAEVYIGDPGRHPNVFQNYKKHLVRVAQYSISEEDKKLNELSSDIITVWKFVKERRKKKKNKITAIYFSLSSFLTYQHIVLYKK